MKHSKYSYNGYTIDYSLITKDEVYSQGMNTVFAASVAMFIRNNKIEDFHNLVIINSIKDDVGAPNIDDNHIRVAFQAFLYYELNDAGTNNIIVTELDMYDHSRTEFIKLVTAYTMLGFISIKDAFVRNDTIAFVLASSSAKSFIQKVVEVAVDNM